ncbi:MAG: hypothetical protein ABSA57_06745 [Candidatus Acidiferrales bacterium]|jgi:hypothetical protein
MKPAKLILGLAFLALAIIVSWQIASCEWANFQLHENLRDLGAQGGAQIGLAPPRADDQLRDEIVHEAKALHIQLAPSQVTVQHLDRAHPLIVTLVVDYTAPVKLPGYSFYLHFTPSSAK